MSKTVKMNTIKITGKTYFGVDSAEEYMKDMLRYDDATIFSLTQEEGIGNSKPS